MKNLKLNTSIVSAAWLNENRTAPNLIILDASLKKVTDTTANNSKKLQIPGARFFDIKNEFSDVSGQFPNTFPNRNQFTKSAKKIGINKESAIVVYDDRGIYSSPRAWWLFKSFGHHNVAVLDGGLPHWLEAGYEVHGYEQHKGELGDFEAEYIDGSMQFFKDILKELEQSEKLIIDARAKDRFNGLIPEPRKNLRSGHIPGASNMHFEALLNGYSLKNQQELKALFKTINPNQKSMIFSCGSGITACILALAAEVSGYDDLSVYDGSWTEYGTITNS
jgi:thiosulfate/3-mercaptopyruvate sulfurtransferase